MRAAVAVGGAMGTLARVGVALPASPGGWPVATLLVNVSGALLLGVVLTRLRDHRLRALLGTGVLGIATSVLAAGPLLVVGGLLGATTTFSTWMVHADTAASTGRVGVLPLVAGVAAAALGRMLATGLGWVA